MSRFGTLVLGETSRARRRFACIADLLASGRCDERRASLQLLRESGFHLTALVPTASPLSIIEGRPI